MIQYETFNVDAGLLMIDEENERQQTKVYFWREDWKIFEWIRISCYY